MDFGTSARCNTSGPPSLSNCIAFTRVTLLLCTSRRGPRTQRLFDADAGIRFHGSLVRQDIKAYVSSHPRLYQSVSVIPHWFLITYTLNPGAAFSLFANLP